MKRVAIIGVTGSIGGQAVDIIERNPERFSLSMVSAHSHLSELIALAEKHKVPVVCYTGFEGLSPSDFSYPCRVFVGKDALKKGAEYADYDVFLNAVVGIVSLEPTLVAMEKGARIALSNKEMLVSAGDYVMKRSREHGAEIIPVDSEHSAIFQCLQAGRVSDVDRLIITSSGGAFRDVPLPDLDTISPERALEHPNWKMGKKITIDCATMVNKGFEVIEAKHLFGLPMDRIDAVLHRESVVHSMVKFKDGSVIAQLSDPDMRLPIQYALTYPERIPSPVSSPNLPFNLSFAEIDIKRYPCFSLMLEAGRIGGLTPAALLAADSVLVPAYLEKKITYSDIPRILEQVLDVFALPADYILEDVFNINEEAEKYTRNVVNKL